MGGSDKSAKGYMAKENIAKGYIDKATTRPEGRSLRAPKWDEAKNRLKGTSARRCSARGYMTKGTQMRRSENSAKGYINRASESVTQEGRSAKSAKAYINKEFFGQRVYD